MSDGPNYAAALAAIKKVFSDTRVPASQTLEDLRGLRDELDVLIDAVEHAADNTPEPSL